METIGSCAFRECSSLQSITIPNSVTSIGPNPFVLCGNLQFIKVSDENGNYSSDTNGIVYNKNFTSIICYPTGIQSTSFVIPSTVTSIGDYTFYGCNNLETITIGEGVTTIGYGAFFSCTSLKRIYFYGKTPPSCHTGEFDPPCPVRLDPRILPCPLRRNSFVDVPAASVLTYILL